MKKTTAIIAFLAVILCIGGICAYAYMNSNTFLIKKYIETCSIETPNSPDYCKCKAYLNSEYNNEIFKRLALADTTERIGLMSSLPQDKKDAYNKKINRCYHYLSDDDYLAHLEYPFSKSEECVKEAFYKMPQYQRWYMKTHNKDENDKKSVKFGDFYSTLATKCLKKYDSDEEYKKYLVFKYFLEHNSLPEDNFEKCINRLSHEELESYKEKDIKVLIKVEDCIFSEYSADEVISLTAQAQITVMEEDEKKKMSGYRKNKIRKQLLKCMEDKISKLSEEELQEFKNNAPDSEIVNSCIKFE